MVYYIGTVPVASSDLQHWGILGMKWGLRRYRNKDGTLTDAGKARYKNPRDMTDKELRDAVARLNNEKQYNQLIKELDPKPISKGKEIVTKGLKFFGTKVAAPLLESAAKTLGKAMVETMAEETKAQKSDEREKEKKRAEKEAEKERKKKHEESLWDEDRFD